MEDIEKLMPRTRAANVRSKVDAVNLKQYMSQSKIRQPSSFSNAGTRSGVAVRDGVRKDALGFEDIDDFWAEEQDDDDEDSVDKDDSIDDDSLTVDEKDASAGDTSTDSSSSERGVRLSGVSSVRLSDRVGTEVAKRIRKSSTRSSSGRQQSEKPALAPAPRPTSPVPSEPSFDFGGGASPPNPAEENITIRKKSRRGRNKSSTGAETVKTKTNRRETFDDEAPGFDADVASPFTMDDGAMTPLSNASDRTLKSIPSFSDKGSASTPDISKDLFKKGEYGSSASDASDGESKKKKKSTKAKAKAKKTPKVKSTPTPKTKKTPKVRKMSAQKKVGGGPKNVGVKTPKKPRPTGNYAYRTPTSTDESAMSTYTDEDDESFQAYSDDGGETGDDSFFIEPEVDTARPARDVLPDADKILDEEAVSDSDSDGSTALRRSKRRRFKPLAWYKGEHFVYERTFVGVGAVMPTVAGVERTGAESPTRAEPKLKAPSKRVNNGMTLARSALPDDVRDKIEDSEWASLYDAQAGCMNDLNIICRSSEVRLRRLPTEERGGAVVSAFAGQSFNLFSPSPFARWISGRVVLPPGAWKEPEGVGSAVQSFFVTGCQPKSLELALSPDTDDEFFASKHTTHFLLSAGDEFYVPAGNVYYVKNHSATADCDLRFTILKPESTQKAKLSEEDASAEEKKATQPKRKREEDDTPSGSSTEE